VKHLSVGGIEVEVGDHAAGDSGGEGDRVCSGARRATGTASSAPARAWVVAIIADTSDSSE
jgi:hypothetical protein